jgi:SAM-dependent methyltransferase
MHTNNISKVPFDSEAQVYDQIFTNSKIGNAQRKIVWNMLDKFISNNRISSVFEINCGTGEDALHLLKNRVSVFPSDISANMVEETNLKLTKNGFPPNATILDITKLNSFSTKGKYDLIFSNFGGLNCISEEELKVFFENSSKLFLSQKNYILVFMGKYCLAEKLYFLCALRFNEINRRSSKANVKANLKYDSIDTTFYTVQQIKKCLPKNLNIVSCFPLGFFIPPSYLESFFKRNNFIFKMLTKLESLVTNLFFLSNFSDHFIIQISSND